MDISFYNLNKAIKSGKKSISYKYLEGFCKALNCSFNDLLTIVVNDNIRIGGKYWLKYYNVSSNVQIKIIKIIMQQENILGYFGIFLDIFR